MALVLIALSAMAPAARAHEDFPAEWCGGEDCRFAEPQDLRIECGGIAVRTDAILQTVPLSQVTVWNGERPAICGRNAKLNLCNPSKGDCSRQEGLGLLIPETEWEAMRAAAAALCKGKAAEAMRFGQSVPGLAQTRAPASSGGGGGGGGGGEGSPSPKPEGDPPEDEPTPEPPLVEALDLTPTLRMVRGGGDMPDVPLPAGLGLLVIAIGALLALRARSS
jgi:hypothetical protein